MGYVYVLVDRIYRKSWRISWIIKYQYIISYETIKDEYVRYTTDSGLLNINAKIDGTLRTNITCESLQQIKFL